MRGIYTRSLFLAGWLVLTIAAAHALVGAGSAQTAYPHFLHASAR